MPNDSAHSTKGKKSRLDWARHWFSHLARFHKVHDRRTWIFTEDDVIAFLRSKLKSGFPAWKRLLIVKGLTLYRDKFLKSKTPRVEHIRIKLTDIANRERRSALGDSAIEEAVGKINPREPDIIQELRRTLRVKGKSYNTEKAYVKWVRRFMGARFLKKREDFAKIGATDVEAFLSDLAVDGGVAAA